MSARSANWLVFLLGMVCLALTPTLDAQKGGGKPAKPVDQPASAIFRCNGPTAQTHEPPGTPCGPYTAVGAPDGITGDGEVYIGVGAASSPGAFVRSDGELEITVRSTQTRVIFLNFERVVMPPGPGARKTWDFADLMDLDINTNVIDPATHVEAANGALSIPVGATWQTRIKGAWNDSYGVGWAIRFNPDTYPGSHYAWVTRTSDKQWILYATDREVARLVTNGERHSGPVNEGWYLMPFEITVTLP
jgi:hypothetical protein